MINAKKTPSTDARIDAYIARSADFARPILEHLRKLIHKAWPDVVETIKWGMPYFQNNGALLCHMAAFKEHCAFGLWNASLLTDPEGILQLNVRKTGQAKNITRSPETSNDGPFVGAASTRSSSGITFASSVTANEPLVRSRDKKAMGQFDRITSKKDLPSDKTMIAYIREAAELNEKGVKRSRPKAAVKKELPVPPALAAALKKNKKALATFEGFPPSHRREYIEWITEAKTDATREKRIATTLEWLTEGKSINWKYKK